MDHHASSHSGLAVASFLLQLSQLSLPLSPQMSVSFLLYLLLSCLASPPLPPPPLRLTYDCPRMNSSFRFVLTW